MLRSKAPLWLVDTAPRQSNPNNLKSEKRQLDGSRVQCAGRREGLATVEGHMKPVFQYTDHPASQPLSHSTRRAPQPLKMFECVSVAPDFAPDCSFHCLYAFI